MNSYGIRLKQVRRVLGLTQIQLAEQAGIAVSSLRRYEAGEREPPLSALEKCAKAMGLSLNELLNGDIMHLYDEMKSVAEEVKESIQSFDLYQKLLEKNPEMAEWDWQSILTSAELIQIRFDRLVVAFAQLNGAGQLKAIEWVEELADIPRYREDINIPDIFKRNKLVPEDD